MAAALLLSAIFLGQPGTRMRTGEERAGGDVAAWAAGELARELSVAVLSSAPQFAREGSAGGAGYLLKWLASTILQPLIVAVPGAMEPGGSVSVSCMPPRLVFQWANDTAVELEVQDGAGVATLNFTVPAGGKLAYTVVRRADHVTITQHVEVVYMGSCPAESHANITLSAHGMNYRLRVRVRYENCTPTLFEAADAEGRNASVALDGRLGRVAVAENGTTLPLDHSIAIGLARLSELLPGTVRAETLETMVVNGSKLYTILVKANATVAEPVPVGLTARAMLTLLEARPWLLVAQRVELASLRAWITLNNTTYTIGAHNITLDFNCTVHRG